MRVSIQRAMLLQKFYEGGRVKYRKYDIEPGTYFLEERLVFDEKWLCLEGLDVGLELKTWLKLVGKGMVPKCDDAKGYFCLMSYQMTAAQSAAV